MFLEDLHSNQDSEICSLCQFLSLDPEPLIKIKLQAENTLKQRRTQRKYIQYLTKTGLLKLFPQSFKSFWSKSSLVSIEQSTNLKPCWPDSALQYFTEAIDSDLKSFLKANGKSEDFYSLQ
jgi:hypothetical protein